MCCELWQICVRIWCVTMHRLAPVAQSVVREGVSAQLPAHTAAQCINKSVFTCTTVAAFACKVLVGVSDLWLDSYVALCLLLFLGGCVREQFCCCWCTRSCGGWMGLEGGKPSDQTKLCTVLPGVDASTQHQHG